MTDFGLRGSPSPRRLGRLAEERRQADAEQAGVADLQQFAAGDADAVPMRRRAVARWVSFQDKVGRSRRDIPIRPCIGKVGKGRQTIGCCLSEPEA